MGHYVSLTSQGNFSVILNCDLNYTLLLLLFMFVINDSVITL